MRRLLVLGVALVSLLPDFVRAQQPTAEQTAPASTPQPADVIEYFHLDAAGNIRAITNEQGQVIERHDYLPFGEEWNPTPGNQPLRFTGKERDTETGFDYFGARYYQAKWGRFTTTDPVYTWRENLVDPQRWNRYAYGRNNPLRYVDPDGKFIIPAAVIIGGTVLYALLASPDIANAPGRADPTFRSDQSGKVIANAAIAAGVLTGAARAAELLSPPDQRDPKPGTPSLRDLGTIGRPGSGRNVREVVGTADDAEGLFRRLSEGGAPVEKTGYPGRAVEFKDGTFVGYRPESKSGPPTIDVGVPGRDSNIKIKFVPE